MPYLVRKKPRGCLKKKKSKLQTSVEKNAFLCVCFFGLFDFIYTFFLFIIYVYIDIYIFEVVVRCGKSFTLRYLIFEKFPKEKKMKILPWCEVFVFMLYDNIVRMCRYI